MRRPNDQRGGGLRRERLAMKAAGSGGCGCASRVETASLSLLIARHGGGCGSRGVAGRRERGGWRAMRPTRAWLVAGQAPGAGAVVQSSAGRPPVSVRWRRARPAAARVASACSTRSAERLRWQRSRIWVRVSPSGERASAVWMCSASGRRWCGRAPRRRSGWRSSRARARRGDAWAGWSSVRRAGRRGARAG
jgi:hypothetical protein